MNPYRLIERIGRIIGITLVSLFLALFVLGISIGAYKSWGWWALLIIPAIPATLLVAGLIVGCCIEIEYQWGKRKAAWDSRAIDTKEEMK